MPLQSAPSFVPSKDDVQNTAGLPNKPIATGVSMKDIVFRINFSDTFITQGSKMTPEEIAAKRAEIASKLAKFNLPGVNTAKNSSISMPPPPPSESAPPLPPGPPGLSPDLAKRVAEAKRKVEAMATQATGVNPYLVMLSFSQIICIGPHLLSNLAICNF